MVGRGLNRQSVMDKGLGEQCMMGSKDNREDVIYSGGK